MAYSEKVLDHYENPRNVGSFDKQDEEVGSVRTGSTSWVEAQGYEGLHEVEIFSALDWWRLHLAATHDLGTGSTASAAPYVLPLAVLGTVLLGKAWLVLDVLLDDTATHNDLVNAVESDVGLIVGVMRRANAKRRHKVATIADAIFSQSSF